MKKNILFREHRGSLEASIKTQTKFNTLIEMLNYISKIFKIDINLIKVDLYDRTPDTRIQWPNTYIIYAEDMVYDVEIFGFFTILKEGK